MRVFVAGSLLAALLLPAAAAGAFTFADGTSAQCTAAQRAVPEMEMSAEWASRGLTAKAIDDAGGPRIMWNVAKLASLPPAMHDYLFFHECAHLRVPTDDEIKANCVGLNDMRAAGRAGFAVEAQITAFYGPGNDYWAKTLKCADAKTSSSPTAPSAR